MIGCRSARPARTNRLWLVAIVKRPASFNERYGSAILALETTNLSGNQRDAGCGLVNMMTRSRGLKTDAHPESAEAVRINTRHRAKSRQFTSASRPFSPAKAR